MQVDPVIFLSLSPPSPAPPAVENSQLPISHSTEIIFRVYTDNSLHVILLYRINHVQVRRLGYGS